MVNAITYLLSIIIPLSIISTTKAGFYVCEPNRFTNLGLDITQYAFCDKRLSYNERAKDLVERMSISEKIQQMGNTAKGVIRIGLPPYQWWNEALHGISDQGVGGVKFDAQVPGATSFPTVILTTASFNESLWKTIGQVVSSEGRAMYNLNHAGITYWSPVVNVARDPRWGRILEVPGEDPFVVGKYSVNFVRGMQDVPGNETSTYPNSRPLKVAACCKHMAAYDLEIWGNATRFDFDAKVTEQDMIETFLAPFEMCVKEGDVSSIMCSYNRVNGIPTCADPKLLNETIRGDWNLHGYIVADCDAVEEMKVHQNFLNDTAEEIVAKALKAGLDLDCENWRTHHSYYQDHLDSAAQQGKIREDDIDRSLLNLYVVLMRLGYFDGNTPFETLGKNDICTSPSIQLAVEAARQGIVLLKNANNTLPLNPIMVDNLAVIGPHANATKTMIGNYAGKPCKFVTPLGGFLPYANVTYAPGCQNVKCQDPTLLSPAMEVAKNADATIILIGLDQTVETEDLDRTNLLLPGYQTQLINQVAQVSKGPTIVVIMSAGGVDMSFANNNNFVNAILWAGYPGAEGGQAIADVVFGKYNPGGRLPITWYQNDYVNKIPMTSMQLRPNPSLGYPGRTYRFYEGPVVYPFGYGLSYTNFRYTPQIPPLAKPLSMSITLDQRTLCLDISYTKNNITQKPFCPAVDISDLDCHENFTIEVMVENIGGREGSEIVMVYSKPPLGIDGAHLKKVIGFQRIFVPVGGSQKVQFMFNACKSLGIVDYKSAQLLPFGTHSIIIGDGVVTFPVQVSLTRRQ